MGPTDTGPSATAAAIAPDPAAAPDRAGPVPAGGAGAGPPAWLTVLYDEQCAFCRQCRVWLEGQPTLVPVTFLAAGSPEALARYGDLPWRGEELVVVSDRGEAWIGPAAFIMCLWATEDHRYLAHQLSGRALAPLAETALAFVSHRRRSLARLAARRECPGGRCGSHLHPI